VIKITEEKKIKIVEEKEVEIKELEEDYIRLNERIELLKKEGKELEELAKKNNFILSKNREELDKKYP